MTLAITIIALVFAAIVLVMLHFKRSIKKIFEEFETEEPLDESDIMAVFHENKNN